MFSPRSYFSERIGSWLFAKFLIFLIPTFLVFTVVGLQELIRQQSVTNTASLKQHVQNQAGVSVAALSRLSIDMELGLSREILSSLARNPNVSCVALISLGTSRALVEFPENHGCAGQPDDALLHMMVDTEHELRVGYNLEMLQIAEQNLVRAAYLTAFGGGLLLLVFSAIGFHLIVNLPLRGLLFAMEKSRLDGHPTLVNNHSYDELGQLSRAFDTLQTAQTANSARLRLTLDALRQVYNTTPSMMFSLDRSGLITRMSTFWQHTTGYSSSELLGQPLSNFLDERSAEIFRSQIMPLLETTGQVRDILLRLHCQNDVEMDVLFSASALNGQEMGPSLSQGEADFFCAMNDVTLLKKAERQLQRISMTDHLTGLPNRADLSQYLNDLFAGPLQNDERAAVLFVDLDNFKSINDTFGHNAGDRVLVEATQRLVANVRGEDYIARLGGDEFAVICRHLKGDNGAVLTARRLINSLQTPIDIGDPENSAVISASIGIAMLNKNVLSPRVALDMADKAMYQAKKQGRNSFAVHGVKTTPNA